MMSSTPNNLPPTQVNGVKCRGCEHFQSQLGTAGMCDVGTYPQLCGGGEDPEHGYRPLGGGMVDISLMSEGAKPGENVPEDRISIPMQIIDLSRSLASQVRSDCPLHAHRRDTGMTMSTSVPMITEMCSCLKGTALAQHIRKGLPPQYQRLSDQKILDSIK